MQIHPSFAALATLRELEVLGLFLEGFTTAEIGERLNISPRTAEVHRLRLLRMGRARNAIELYIAATTGRPGRAVRKPGRTAFLPYPEQT